MESPRPGITSSIGLLILRLGIGGFMLTHGWGKLQMMLAGDFDKFGDPIGVGSAASLVLVVVAEFVAPLLIMLGLATRIAAVFPAVAMGVAALLVHGADPWTMGAAAELFQAGEAKSWASKEPAMLFLIPFLALIFTGPGMFSLDHLFCSRRRSKEDPA